MPGLTFFKIKQSTRDIAPGNLIEVFEEETVIKSQGGVKKIKIGNSSKLPCIRLTSEFVATCTDCGRMIKNYKKSKMGDIDSFKGNSSILCSTCLSSKKQEIQNCSHCKLPHNKKHLKYNCCLSCIGTAPTRLIRKYSTKVEQILPKRGNPLDGLFIGVEIEYESKDLGLDTLIVNDLIQDFARLKRDSSINCGFEIVTQPASISEHYKIWENFFERLPETVMPDKTCGMHVHVSRAFLSDLQIGKLLAFIHEPNNRKFIELMSGRPSSHHNDFTRKKQIIEGRGGGNYQKYRDRHTAINLNNPHTVEFRLFRSPVTKLELFKNIEFSLAAYKFCSACNCSMKDIKSFDAFIRFCATFFKEYPNLVKWMFKSENKDISYILNKNCPSYIVNYFSRKPHSK